MKTKKYGKADSAIFTIEGIRTPTCVFFHPFSWGAAIQIEYRYDVDGNTLRNKAFTYISRKEFYKLLKEVEANLKGKIFVKKTWV